MVLVFVHPPPPLETMSLEVEQKQQYFLQYNINVTKPVTFYILHTHISFQFSCDLIAYSYMLGAIIVHSLYCAPLSSHLNSCKTCVREREVNYLYSIQLAHYKGDMLYHTVPGFEVLSQTKLHQVKLFFYVHQTKELCVPSSFCFSFPLLPFHCSFLGSQPCLLSVNGSLSCPSWQKIGFNPHQRFRQSGQATPSRPKRRDVGAHRTPLLRPQSAADSPSGAQLR